MLKIISVLEELNRLYRDLQVAAFADCNKETSNATVAVAETILRQRSLLVATEKAQARLSAMMGRWCDEPCAPDELRRCRDLAAAAQRKVERLIDICRERALLLESGLAAMRQDLKQIENGARYLQSSRAATAPRPKFIDSVG